MRQNVTYSSNQSGKITKTWKHKTWKFAFVRILYVDLWCILRISRLEFFVKMILWIRILSKNCIMWSYIYMLKQGDFQALWSALLNISDAAKYTTYPTMELSIIIIFICILFSNISNSSPTFIWNFRHLKEARPRDIRFTIHATFFAISRTTPLFFVNSRFTLKKIAD